MHTLLVMLDVKSPVLQMTIPSIAIILFTFFFVLQANDMLYLNAYAISSSLIWNHLITCVFMSFFSVFELITYCICMLVHE